MNFAASKQLLLAPDANLPQRDVLLDATKMAERLSTRLYKYGTVAMDECKTTRVKYRFGENLRVLYNVRCGDHELKVAARTFSDNRGAEICRQFLQNATGSTPTSPFFFDDELKTVFFIFPNDRKISNLRVLSNVPENLAKILNRTWTMSRLVAYAPEKCATAQCLDESGEVIAYAKVFAGEEGRRIFDTYKRFNHTNIRLPQALAYSDSQRTLILEAIHGERVADLSLENESEAYQKFGVAVAMFHQAAPIANLEPFKRLDAVEIPSAFQTILKALPDSAFHTARVFEKLSAFPYRHGPVVCLHGDLHAKNAIWRHGKLTLIDLDQVSTGDAAVDIGSFLAGLHYRECVGQMPPKTRISISKKFLEGYAGVRSLPSEGAMRRHTAAALFAERSLRAITRFRVEGLENIGRILTATENILDGGEL